MATEFFFCGPLFTAEGGHGTEYAKFMPEIDARRFQRAIPAHSENRRRKRANKSTNLRRKASIAIKGVLEAGVPGYTFNRMDLDLLRAVVEEAHAKNFPVAIHTGERRDVVDAVSLGADSDRARLVPRRNSRRDDRRDEGEGYRLRSDA